MLPRKNSNQLSATMPSTWTAPNRRLNNPRTASLLSRQNAVAVVARASVRSRLGPVPPLQRLGHRLVSHMA
jgi:hypothetical protein